MNVELNKQRAMLLNIETKSEAKTTTTKSPFKTIYLVN